MFLESANAKGPGPKDWLEERETCGMCVASVDHCRVCVERGGGGEGRNWVERGGVKTEQGGNLEFLAKSARKRRSGFGWASWVCR